MVQSYWPGGANVPSHVGTLAPPIKYDWTYASFGPPESTSQTANRSFEPFLHRLRQSVIGHIGAAWRIRSNLCFLRPSSPQPKRKIVRFNRFCTAYGRYFTMSAHFPKIAFCHGESGPHLTHDSLGPSESTTQQASWLLQSFLHRWHRVFLYFTVGCPVSPHNCSFPWGDLDSI